jgi:hypothetical protein
MKDVEGIVIGLIEYFVTPFLWIYQKKNISKKTLTLILLTWRIW